MPKQFFVFILALILFFSLAVTAHCSGLIYSNPIFRGRIIDAETKQPIEGAVAVALYDKQMLIGGPGGPHTHVFHFRECLTDKKGDFYFPSYSSLHFISKGDGVRFIFYKPGYMADYGPAKISPTLMEKYFSVSEVGKVLEIEGGTFEQGSYVKWKGPMGIVELQQPKTREEKWKAPLVFTSSLGSKELPLLYKSIDEAEKNLKLEGIR